MDDIEKRHLANLLKLIKRAKFDDLSGLEAITLSRGFDWFQAKLNSAEIVAAPQTQPIVEEKVEKQKDDRPKRLKRNKQ